MRLEPSTQYNFWREVLPDPLLLSQTPPHQHGFEHQIYQSPTATVFFTRCFGLPRACLETLLWAASASVARVER
jgi:hypothetical protein